MLEEPPLWEKAREEGEYQRFAKVVAEKVLRDVVQTMNNHPIKAYNDARSRLSVMVKGNMRLMLVDYTSIVVPDRS